MEEGRERHFNSQSKRQREVKTQRPFSPPRTLLALGCHVGMADEKAEDNLKKTKLPKT